MKDRLYHSGNVRARQVGPVFDTTGEAIDWLKEHRAEFFPGNVDMILSAMDDDSCMFYVVTKYED
jgi:hypothetical protein